MMQHTFRRGELELFIRAFEAYRADLLQALEIIRDGSGGWVLSKHPADARPAFEKELQAVEEDLERFIQGLDAIADDQVTLAGLVHGIFYRWGAVVDRFLRETGDAMRKEAVQNPKQRLAYDVLLGGIDSWLAWLNQHPFKGYREQQRLLL